LPGRKDKEIGKRVRKEVRVQLEIGGFAAA
jgi:hypothetical protein